MVIAAVAFIAGVLGALGYSYVAGVGLVTLVAAVLQRSSLRPAFIALVFFALGFLDADFRVPTPFAADRHMTTFAVVVEQSQAVDEAQALVVRMPDGRQASLTIREPEMPIGERLTIRAEREPFDGSRNPGEPARRDIEAERGISFALEHVRIIARAPPDDADATLWLPRVRKWASRRIHALLGEPDATILAGAMWGERGALAPELRAEFQNTGTVHVLVTAGLHLGVVAALALGIFSYCGLGRIASSLTTIPVIWTYAALSGSHLPSVRAATMLTFALVARAVGRDAYSWNALALAALVIAAWRPEAVASLSFALSFSCVAAIFAFARPCGELLERLGTGHTLAQLFGVALATQIGTWPLTAFGFLVIAPYAPLANAAVVPVVGVAMLSGFATLLASPIPAVAHPIANITISLVDWIATVVRLVARLPGAHVIATPPPIWTIVSYDASLAAFALALHRNRFTRVAALGVAATTAVCLWPPHTNAHDLIITAIDVGQADSILIQTPNGHAFLVDGGGRLESGSSSNGTDTAELIGERIVVPFLIRRGIHHLDAILLSHPHGDHAGGLPPILQTLGAGGFADSGQTYRGHAFNDALAIAHANGVAMLEPRAGDVWHTDDGVTFRFYGPSLPYIAGGMNDINDNSLVMRLEYRSFRMLFTGDAGELAEQRLLASGADLRSDVLKVGHHGSAYGTTPDFVRAVAPRVAIISVGRHNLFGHPAPSTIATLEDSGARVYRTDRDGAITLRFDGGHLSVTPTVSAR